MTRSANLAVTSLVCDECEKFGYLAEPFFSSATVGAMYFYKVIQDMSR